MTTHKIIQGDVIDGLRTLPDKSVHCVVTSPPYYNLRSYGCDGQIGLETTPELYVQKMVEVFREVKRVLRDDGTCWLNLGDSYAMSTVRGGDKPFSGNVGAHKGYEQGSMQLGKRGIPEGIKQKDLIGIPWMTAFALRADGWYLRSDIIWHKINPMPESTKDRPTKSHEYVFLLTKSPIYYYDAEAIREENQDKYNGKRGTTETRTKMQSAMKTFSTREEMNRYSTSGRNKRTVWTIATQPTKDAHFATFPEKLVTPCIEAGTSEKGVCSECGAPYLRILDKREMPGVNISELDRYGNGNAGIHRKVGGQYQKWLDANPPSTIGWNPTCKCGCECVIPCTVLDPFMGSGTVALVAKKLNRSSIGCELNPEYIGIYKRKLNTEQMSVDDTKYIFETVKYGV